MISKYLYISLNISIFLPRASNSLYISVPTTVLSHINSYAPSAVLNLHIKSYSPYFDIILAHRVVTYSPHKEMCPLLQC